MTDPRKTMQRILLLIFGLCLFGAGTCQAKVPIFPIVQGVLDLRSWDPNTNPVFKIEGEAEFYWQRFILKDNKERETRKYIPFPGPWNLKGDYPYHGFASVRIHVLMPDVDSISMQWGWIWTASEVYVEGKLIHKSGVIGQDPDSAVSGAMSGWLVHLQPTQKEFDIVLQMSNYDLFLGGHVESISMGSFEGIQAQYDKKRVIESFLMGAIFIMAIYHSTLYLLRRQDLSTLYFGLFCLAIGFHMSVGSGSSLLGLVWNAGFRGRILIYNLSWMMSIPIFALFVRSLFPQEFSLIVAKILIGICLCFLVFLGATEVRTFIFSTQLYQIIALGGTIYAIYAISLAVKHHRSGARAFLIAISILALCSINDMLMIRGIIDSVQLAAPGLFIFIFGQSYLLSVRFSRAFSRAERSEAKVRKLADDLRQQNSQISVLNQTLESRVEEQTRDIRSFMEHTPIAIFAIEHSDATIHRDYSLQLEGILEEKNLANRAILPLLFAGSSLTQDEVDQLKNALSSMIGESSLAFELNEQMLPRKFTKTRRNGEIRQFEAIWNPIINDKECIEKILVALTDVTEMLHLESKARERAEELQTIGEILSVTDEAFQRFIRSCKNFNQQNRQLLVHADPKLRDREVVKIVFMNMHTMKGAARTLRFRKLSDLFHDLESYYSHLAKQDHENWDLGLMRRDIDVIDQSLLEYENIALEKLGRKLGDGVTIVLPIHPATQGFQDLHRMAGQFSSLNGGLLGLYAALQDALFLPLPLLMEDIFKDVKSLAKDLDKPTPETRLQLPSVLIRVQSEELLRNTFVHLLRNSLDHGIEVPEERSRKSKDKIGLIHLSGKIEQDMVVLWLEDDGRGLNLNRLANLGRERKIIASDAEPTDEACAELIFSDGISTARTVTSISGRGMGMAAVRSYLEEAGGRIKVEFMHNGPFPDQIAPFRLRLELPLRLFSTRLEPRKSLPHSA